VLKVLKHLPIGTQVNFITERFNELSDDLAYAYALENSHRIMIESNCPWLRINFMVLVKNQNINPKSAQQSGKGRSYRAISNNGNVMHPDSQTDEAGAFALYRT
jgi:hypothetical protein